MRNATCTGPAAAGSYLLAHTHTHTLVAMPMADGLAIRFSNPHTLSHTPSTASRDLYMASKDALSHSHILPPLLSALQSSD